MTFTSRRLSILATTTAAIASTVAYPLLPRRIATHFDVDGRPDRYGSRMVAALGIPAVMAAIAAINDRLGAWPCGNDREEGDSSIQTRNEALALVELALLPAHLDILLKGAGLHIDTSRVQRGVYGVLMIALGNILPKIPRNWLIGIRTPWTMADSAVWERTHRLGGYLITAAGLVSLASLPATGKRARQIPIAALLSAVGVSVVYSYVAYTRRDQ